MGITIKTVNVTVNKKSSPKKSLFSGSKKEGTKKDVSFEGNALVLSLIETLRVHYGISTSDVVGLGLATLFYYQPTIEDASNLIDKVANTFYPIEAPKKK